MKLIPFGKILIGLLTCKSKNSHIEGKKLQIGSAIEVKIHKYIFLNFNFEFRMFKNEFVDFYLIALPI
jgi:hypothetical protein